MKVEADDTIDFLVWLLEPNHDYSYGFDPASYSFDPGRVKAHCAGFI